MLYITMVPKRVIPSGTRLASPRSVIESQRYGDTHPLAGPNPLPSKEGS